MFLSARRYDSCHHTRQPKFRMTLRSTKGRARGKPRSSPAGPTAPGVWREGCAPSTPLPRHRTRRSVPGPHDTSCAATMSSDRASLERAPCTTVTLRKGKGDSESEGTRGQAGLPARAARTSQNSVRPGGAAGAGQGGHVRAVGRSVGTVLTQQAKPTDDPDPWLGRKRGVRHRGRECPKNCGDPSDMSCSSLPPHLRARRAA